MTTESRVRPEASVATDDMPDPRVVLPRRRPTLNRAAGFWLVAGTTAALLAASSAPSPLYPVLQAKYGFSALTLTTIFAVYVLALLASLLTVGGLSDLVGRRPVLATALVVELASMAVFLVEDGVGALIVARIVQGLATGAAIGVLGAYLLDLQPPGGGRLGSLVNSVAPATGLAIGAAGTGVLVEYGPHPTRLVFGVFAVLFAVLVLATALLPETVSRIPGALASLRPKVAVPVAARRAFVAALPIMAATWALGGLFLSVGGSVVGEVFGETNHAVVGAAIATFMACAAIAGISSQRATPAAMSLGGAISLSIGTILFVIAVAAESRAAFVPALVLAGAGFGTAFLGALRTMTQLAPPHERAALLSAVFVVSYVAFSIPALVAGLLIPHLGLQETAVGYGVLVAVLALGALGTLRRAA